MKRAGLGSGPGGGEPIPFARPPAASPAPRACARAPASQLSQIGEFESSRPPAPLPLSRLPCPPTRSQPPPQPRLFFSLLLSDSYPSLTCGRERRKVASNVSGVSPLPPTRGYGGVWAKVLGWAGWAGQRGLGAGEGSERCWPWLGPGPVRKQTSPSGPRRLVPRSAGTTPSIGSTCVGFWVCSTTGCGGHVVGRTFFEGASSGLTGCSMAAICDCTLRSQLNAPGSTKTTSSLQSGLLHPPNTTLKTPHSLPSTPQHHAFLFLGSAPPRARARPRDAFTASAL